MTAITLSENSGLSPEQAETLLRCYYLGEFMSGWIVEAGYKPPVQLPMSLKFTTRGSRLVSQVKGNSIDQRDAQIAVFSTVWAGNELLIDINQVDIDAIRGFLSSEIKRGKIRYPWVYGRDLYDRVTKSNFWGHSHPTPEESKSIVEDLPKGVFQLGPYLCGPYGLLEARQWRTNFSSHTVPGYHCEEVECDSIHGIRLSSADNGIDRANIAIREKISKGRTPDTRYIDAAFRIEAKQIPPYRWNNSSRLPYFLMDSFSLDELRLLLVRLLDGTAGTLRAELTTNSIEVKAADAFAHQAGKSELLQVILLAKDSEIHQHLNSLIWSEDISIAEGEVRTPKIASGGSSPLGVRMEASKMGVRFRPSSVNLPIRLQGIIDHAYPRNEEKAQARLNWLLRHVSGDSAHSRLNAALVEANPTELVERLIIADEFTYKSALSDLELPHSFLSDKSDHEIARFITWHCGFTVDSETDSLRNLFESTAELSQVIAALPANFLEPADVSRIQKVSSQLFPSLEKVLKTTLQFSTWALLYDHFDNGYSLVYSTERGQTFFSELISKMNHRLETTRSEDMTLGDLLSSFGLLAKHLSDLNRNEGKYLRDHEKWPTSARDYDSPFDFPFKHTYPFLDLDREGRTTLLSVLQKVCSELSASGVTTVRNKFLHDSSEIPQREEILKSIRAVETLVRELVGQGLYPSIFSSSGLDRDKYGRSRHLMNSESGIEILLTRPSSAMLFGFPSITDPQVIVTGARLSAGSEPLRFKYQVDSEYQRYWEQNFPARPARRAMPGASGGTT